MKGQGSHRRGFHVHAVGPWPFITRRSYMREGRSIVWMARRSRKGLDFFGQAQGASGPPIWQSPVYNWGLGAFFAAGSFLFMLGSAMSLVPEGVLQPSARATNIVFFLGSIPFTIAAYMQHFQAANARAFTLDPKEAGPRQIALIGWHPTSAGWLSTFTQFLGTLAFNVNTFNAILDPHGWYQQDVAIWVPDMVGSVLFLVSGYLAFIEAGHRYWSWKPRELSWRIVFVNLIGCIAFMTSAVLAYVPSHAEPAWIGTVSTVHLLIGAFCFFVGAILTMQEGAMSPDAV